MLSDFSFSKKESANGMYGKRTTLYDNYEFDNQNEESFYKENIDPYEYDVYNRPDQFWEEEEWKL